MQLHFKCILYYVTRFLLQSSLQQQHVFLTSLFSKGVKGTEFSLLFALFIDHLPRPGEGNKSPAQRTLEYSRQLRELRQG